MVVQHLSEAFTIKFMESDTCPMGTHKHTFYELVYIISGQGRHVSNGNTYAYDHGSLFMLSPLEAHHFLVDTTTHFAFVCFNNIYLRSQAIEASRHPLSQWAGRLEYVLQNSRFAGNVIQAAEDQPLVSALITAMHAVIGHDQVMQQEVMQQLTNTLLTVVVRNITLLHAVANLPVQNTALAISSYIQQHIYEPEKLKAAHLAEQFHLSPAYISEYFKKQTGENLQQYIILYKLSLAESRLQYSDLRLNEIADELGFTDESHLTKMFKKHKGLTPAQYRRQGVKPIVAAVG